MKRILLLAFMVCCLAAGLQAQVFSWSVKPGTYSRIAPLWGSMYRVYDGDKVGVIRGDGTVLFAPDRVEITGFHEGYALILKDERGDKRIAGILSTKGECVKPGGVYYAIKDQEFFSEGWLTVITTDDRGGYMKPDGSVKEFNYADVYPFTEGYAAVYTEDGEYDLIDKKFNAIDISLGSASEIQKGTNVYNGEIILVTMANKWFRYNVKNQTAKKFSAPSLLEYDYLYCLTKLTNRPETVPYDLPYRPSVTLKSARQGGMYGYVNGSQLALPYQFDAAEDFYGDYAIVTNNRGTGILTYDGRSAATFSATPTQETINYKKNKNRDLSHSVRISAPNAWHESNLSVAITDENGKRKETSRHGDTYDFSADASGQSQTFNVEISADGLKLWKSSVTYSYNEEKGGKGDDIRDDEKNGGNGGTITLPTQRLRISLSGAKELKADKNNRCYVTATVTNPNPRAISTTVFWSGNNMLIGNQARINIPANGSKSVSIPMEVKKAKKVDVAVSTSDGASAKLTGIQVIPFITR